MEYYILRKIRFSCKLIQSNNLLLLPNSCAEISVLQKLYCSWLLLSTWCVDIMLLCVFTFETLFFFSILLYYICCHTYGEQRWLFITSFWPLAIRFKGVFSISGLNYSGVVFDFLRDVVPRKWCKIRRKSQLITDRKLYTGFRFVQKSIIWMNDLERSKYKSNSLWVQRSAHVRYTDLLIGRLHSWLTAKNNSNRHLNVRVISISW